MNWKFEYEPFWRSVQAVPLRTMVVILGSVYDQPLVGSCMIWTVLPLASCAETATFSRLPFTPVSGIVHDAISPTILLSAVSSSVGLLTS